MCAEARDSGSGFGSVTGDPWTGAALTYFKIKTKKTYTQHLLEDQFSAHVSQMRLMNQFFAVFDMRSYSVEFFFFSFDKYKINYFDYVGLLCEHAGRRQVVGLKGLFYLIHSTSSRYFYSSGHLLPLYLL